MAAMDVLIMPWNRSEWIKACNPIKLKEYLAVGRPVVTRDFPALDGWRDLVRTADDAETFSAEIHSALAAAFDPEPARNRVSVETWDAKAQTIRDGFSEIGLVWSPSKSRSIWRAGVPAKAAI
jgi:hypothetical protein